MNTQNARILRLAVTACLGMTLAMIVRGAPGSQGSEKTNSACDLQPGVEAPMDVVALVERVDPANAPYPSNESQRLLFRQLYETLVRVDCDGRVLPGLASSWRFDNASGAWLVTLRDGARFSDDAPVTAADVAATWTTGNGMAALRTEVRRVVKTVMAIDESTIEIVLQNPHEDAVRVLAHTDLSIAKRTPGSPWPLGTRRTKVLHENGAWPSARSSVIAVARLPADPADPPAPGAGDPLSSIRFLNAPGRDARDLLDEGVDLIVTRDPTTLDYAATLPRFVSAPLPWQRTYALIEPGRSREARQLTLEERDLLAHDAVRGEAQGSREPFWWQSLPSSCEAPAPQAAARALTLTPRVVYDSGDPVARELAERLVGLGRASSAGSIALLDALLPDRSSRSFQRAAGLTGAALDAAIRSGADAAYIIALERRPLDSCREIAVLSDAMKWIDAKTIVPLVDTRMRAIVRRGRNGAAIEWDGGLLLVNRDR